MASGTGDGFRKCIRLAMILANLLILVSTTSYKCHFVCGISKLVGPNKQDFGKRSI